MFVSSDGTLLLANKLTSMKFLGQTDVSANVSVPIFTSYTLKMGTELVAETSAKPSHFDAAVCHRKFHVPAKASKFINKILFYNKEWKNPKVPTFVPNPHSGLTAVTSC
jgi:hypothetical protein